MTAPNNGWFATAGERETPFLRIPLVVTAGAHEGEEVVYQGWLSSGASARTIKNLTEVFGEFSLTELAQQMDDGHFVGKPCSIVVEMEEYKGKMRPKIAWLNAPGGGDKMLEINKALQLARQIMGEPDPSWDEKPEPPPAAKPTPQKPTLDEDDIPF